MSARARATSRLAARRSLLRDNIYYWKCDNPTSLAEKQASYFQSKYDQPELADLVRSACTPALGAAPDQVTALRVDGNHLAFAVVSGDQSWLFRADDGAGEDDYLLAEGALMALARAAGVPVPQVFCTDVSRRHCPWRFHLVEFCCEPSLNHLERSGTLDAAAIAADLGRLLRRLHSVPLARFGFIDTVQLAADGTVRGLDRRYADYFGKRLDEHLGYLVRHGLLSAVDGRRVESVLAAAAPLLELSQGVLVHRDAAYWNLLGTPTRITAVVDWDDAVSGDPADDLGMLYCFHGEDFMDRLLTAYLDGGPMPGPLRTRIWLHWLRNMLWKAKLRHALGYFQQGREFFLNAPAASGTLRERTLTGLHRALGRLTTELA